ncbi:hypothetical protein DICVIV_11653, partial [Dictyocaulus viviparus]
EKRRRSGPNDEKVPIKKSRNDESEADVTNSFSEVETSGEIKKKRLRKRTKGLRTRIKDKIELALRTTPTPLAHLFTTLDDAGTPQAAYIDVIKAIGLSGEDWLKAASLSPKAVEAISNITDMFKIERSLEGKLMLKYRPAEWCKDDCTVYLDNLPAGCTSEKIHRIARKFGTVVEVFLPRSPSRQFLSAYGTLEIGKHSRSFAFVQFTDSSACNSMCRAFAHNFPTNGSKENNRSLVPLLQRLLMKIRILSKRRRRRTYAQNVLLMKLRKEQAAIIKKERTANKRTSKISRTDKQRNSFVNFQDGKVFVNDQTDDEHDAEPDDSHRSEHDDSHRSSVGQSDKSQACVHKLQISSCRKKRKRRRRRNTDTGPYAISGSVSDYFGKMQVLPFIRYLELRREYIGLRRESDRRTKELVMHDEVFKDSTMSMNNAKLGRKLDFYRDHLWEVHDIKEDE